MPNLDSEILSWVYFAKAKSTKASNLKAIAKKHKKAIKGAVIASAVGVSAASHAIANGTDPATAVTQNVQIDNTPVQDALGGVYNDSVSAGSKHGGLLLAMGAGLVIALLASRKSMDDVVSEIASGIGTTTLALITASLTKGAAGGLVGNALEATVLAEIASNPRISMIANTESNRGFNVGVQGAFKANGIQQFEWINSESACPVCQALAGTHDINDELPPAHPDCMCSIEPLDNLEVSS